jgi:UDP-N-acetylmuramyl pentapeptide phosphotransferase/UDP-N-acetylglucosamine-1-phosphate transferase
MKPGEPLSLLLAVVTSFLGAFLILPVLIRYTLTKNLVDEPGRRKIHKRKTPSLGGIAIFAGFLIASFIWIDVTNWVGDRYLIGSLIIIFLVGVRDDLVPFSARNKLVGQIAAIIVLLFSGIRIHSLYGLFGFNAIPLTIGIPLTFLFVLIVTNAFNLIDGLDGLAGTLSVISYLAFGIWFFLVGENLFALLCFCMIGGILAFLVFNWEPAEIFMGDSGAMVSGLMLSILTIHFMNTNETLPGDSPVKYQSTIGAAICFIVVPLCDTVRIIILRLSKGKSLFTADKNHLHHGLVRLGLTHSKATQFLGLTSVIFIGAAFLMRSQGDMLVLPIVILSCTILGIAIDRLLIRKAGGKDVAPSADTNKKTTS